MIHYWQASDLISDSIYIPKYYNPEIAAELTALEATHDCFSLGKLVDEGVISCETGHEIGKHAYGTGDIPFVRTSDIANWEIKYSPKQGVSQAIYEEYAKQQDVQEGDILFVRDGTYLIGVNCFITSVDKEILYQSHILKIRVHDKNKVDPVLLFASLNSDIVQRQIRSFQFTADIIDTIGQRFYEIVVPIPKSEKIKESLIEKATNALLTRVKGKAFLKQCPKLIETCLLTNSSEELEKFLALQFDEIPQYLSHETVTSEFGGFEHFWKPSESILSSIYLPKYYDPSIQEELDKLTTNCLMLRLGELRDSGTIEYFTGDEIGKMAYGTGDIPFIRTSDFSNLEIKHDPKQGISEQIYNQYKDGQNVQENDILLVRDGTYLVGSSCLITAVDQKSLFCGGLYKITIKEQSLIDPFLLLGLLNSYIVKRQIRTKQFTRDVIDTIGNRIDEVVLPVPKSEQLRKAISNAIKGIITSRIAARITITEVAKEIVTQQLNGVKI